MEDFALTASSPTGSMAAGVPLNLSSREFRVWEPGTSEYVLQPFWECPRNSIQSERYRVPGPQALSALESSLKRSLECATGSSRPRFAGPRYGTPPHPERSARRVSSKELHSAIPPQPSSKGGSNEEIQRIPMREVPRHAERISTAVPESVCGRASTEA